MFQYLNILYKKIFKEYEVELNVRQKRYLREISINYYLKNGVFNTKILIKKFKIQYNKELNKKKNIEENEKIINLFEDKKEANDEILAPGSIHDSENEDEKTEKNENINENIKTKMQKIISKMQNERKKKEINKKYTFNIKYINTFNYINK